MSNEETDLTGLEWESYKVVKKLDFKGCGNKTLWLCECKCGRRKHMTTSDIRFKKSKQCLNCANRKYVGKISGTVYNHIKDSAKRRKIEFNITHEELWDLYQKQLGKCKLSGIDLYFSDTTEEHKKYRLTTASLDRIDSLKGYVLDNVQWIHKDINMMKQRFSQEYFIQICKNIAENHNNA